VNSKGLLYYYKKVTYHLNTFTNILNCVVCMLPGEVNGKPLLIINSCLENPLWDLQESKQTRRTSTTSASLCAYVNHHQALNTVINNMHFLYISANILSEISAHSVSSSLATLSITVIICCVVLLSLVVVVLVCRIINKYL
jgi:hypothetical protein